eukprot:1180834-Prorocentrum_minimum.AAC.1
MRISILAVRGCYWRYFAVAQDIFFDIKVIMPDSLVRLFSMIVRKLERNSQQFREKATVALMRYELKEGRDRSRPPLSSRPLNYPNRKVAAFQFLWHKHRVNKECIRNKSLIYFI